MKRKGHSKWRGGGAKVRGGNSSFGEQERRENQPIMIGN